ncbi:MAG: insulinase family protein [Candidatus Pacearchaeota archaeon]|nr:insulinase family protein [Candidatus Pacearchaeota archaeon]
MNFLFDKVKELLYRKPFALPILGSKETIVSFDRKTFLEWHDQFYNSSNTIVSVVGNAEIEEIKKLAETLSTYNKKIPQIKISPLNKNREFIEKRKDIDQAHLALAFNVSKLSDKERYASEIFNAILGQGMSSWLFQEVREKRGWAYSIKSFLEQEKDYGHCIVYAGVDKKNLKKVKEIVLKEISKFKELKTRELEEAKEQCIGNWQLEMEDSERTAAALTIQEIATKAEDFYRYDEKISSTKLQDVKNIAEIKNYVFAAVVPK